MNKYDHWFKKYGEKNGIDWLLLKAQVRQESNFRPKAESWVGARGLAQFMKRTWAEWWDGTPGIQQIGDKVQMFKRDNPEASIRSQAAYIRWLLKFFNGSMKTALAGYNAGPGRVRKILRKHGNAREVGYDLAFDTAKPFLPEETQKYVTRIVRFYHEYKNNN